MQMITNIGNLSFQATVTKRISKLLLDFDQFFFETDNNLYF